MRVEFANYIKDCPETCIEKDLGVEPIEQDTGNQGEGWWG